MRRTTFLRLIVVGFAAILLVAALPISASADSPWSDVVIRVTISYDGPSPYGPFTASGDAMDSGLVCQFGDTVDIYSRDQHQNEVGVTRSTVIKRFTCDDGTFDIRSNIINNQIAGFELVFWSVVDGTGAYEGLKGHGTSVGEGGPDNTSIETFTGVLR